jgi:hypothetical protein
VGRYIYTAVPRSVEEVELEIREIDRQIAAAGAHSAPAAPQLPAAPVPALPLAAAAAAVAAETLEGVAPTPTQYRHRQVLEGRRRRLQRRLDRVPAARRLLAVWRAVHVPLTAALFVTAIVHCVGAVYYGSLLH